MRHLALRACGFASSASPPARPRVLVVGSGWGGFQLASDLDKSKFDVRVVSPANHFLFTPMLPGSAVGSVEFRAIQEPVRTIAGLSRYYQAKMRSACLATRTLQCEDVYRGARFSLRYDFLVLAAGCKTNTFGTPGVEGEERLGRHVFFLKHLHHARLIRNRVLECFERAAIPTLSDAERRQLLSFVVVGGGPTSCEFVGELHEFITDDVGRWYGDLRDLASVTLVESGPKLMASFDESLSRRLVRSLERRGVQLRMNTRVVGVHTVDDGGASPSGTVGHVVATVEDMSWGGGKEEQLPVGAMVWSAGLQPVKLCRRLAEEHRWAANGAGRLCVDRHLRLGMNDWGEAGNGNGNGEGGESGGSGGDAAVATAGRVFALGDAAVIRGAELPPIAQKAQQEAQYLACCFNEHYAQFGSALIPRGAETDSKAVAAAAAAPPVPPPPDAGFEPRLIGSMASIGTTSFEGYLDMTSIGDPTPGGTTYRGPKASGLLAWVSWHGAYLVMKQKSIKNRILIAVGWLKTFAFGRDISRF